MERTIERLRNINKKHEVKDLDNRTLLSEFVGSIENDIYLNRRVKVLSWGQIFFRLGKVIESSQNFRTIENVVRDVELVNNKVEAIAHIKESNENGCAEEESCRNR